MRPQKCSANRFCLMRALQIFQAPDPLSWPKREGTTQTDRGKFCADCSAYEDPRLSLPDDKPTRKQFWLQPVV